MDGYEHDPNLRISAQGVNFKSSPMSQTCPHCSSTDTTWKAKAGKWECNACEERFDGPAPESTTASPDSASPSPNSQTQAPTQLSLSDKAAVPKKIFFSYGHDANRELVDRFKDDLEKRGHTVWIDYRPSQTKISQPLKKKSQNSKCDDCLPLLPHCPSLPRHLDELEEDFPDSILIIE